MRFLLLQVTVVLTASRVGKRRRSQARSTPSPIFSCGGRAWRRCATTVLADPEDLPTVFGFLGFILKFFELYLIYFKFLLFC
jgi:hypothetical protein